MTSLKLRSLGHCSKLPGVRDVVSPSVSNGVDMSSLGYLNTTPPTDGPALSAVISWPPLTVKRLLFCSPNWQALHRNACPGPIGRQRCD